MSKQQVEKIVFTIFLVLAALDIAFSSMKSQNPEILNQQTNQQFNEGQGQGSNFNNQNQQDNQDANYEEMNNYYKEKENEEQMSTTHRQKYENNKEKIRNTRKSNSSTSKTRGQKQQAIETSIPNVQVEGMEYPISPQKQLISQILTAIQYGCIALVFFGDSLFSMLKIQPPQWYYKLKENKWTSIIFFFMAGNMINSQLLQSGAFEIFCNDNLIFSKIQSSRMPSLNEILDPISNM